MLVGFKWTNRGRWTGSVGGGGTDECARSAVLRVDTLGGSQLSFKWLDASRPPTIHPLLCGSFVVYYSLRPHIPSSLCKHCSILICKDGRVIRTPSFALLSLQLTDYIQVKRGNVKRLDRFQTK